MKDAFNLPNAITLGRLLCVPVLLVLLFYGPLWLFYTVLAIVLLSDLADGALARAQRRTTGLGKVLDPLADKALFLGLFVALIVQGRLPLMALIAFALPQGVLLLGALWLRVKHARWVIIEARFLGKASSTLISLGLVGVLLAPLFSMLLALPVLYGGIALSYAALGDYIFVAVRQLQRDKFPGERRHEL
jgi:phosphatidylglycerophosphate synthase